MQKIVIALTAASIAALACWYGVRDQPAESKSRTATREPPAVNHQPAAPRATPRLAPPLSTSNARRIEALTDELQGLHEQLDHQSTGADRDDPRDGVRDEPPPPSDPQLLAEAEDAWHRDYAEQLDDALAAEPRDPSWASDARADAVASVSGLDPGSTIHASECGSSLCRLDIAHDDPAGHEQLLTLVQSQFPWQGPAIVMPVDDGGPGTRIYLARPGTNLPEPRSRVEDFFERG